MTVYFRKIPAGLTVLKKELLDDELNEQERLINELDNEVNELIDDSTQNIKYMQLVDLTNVNLNGDTLATDGEYKIAEEQFQILAQRIVGGVNG